MRTYDLFGLMSKHNLNLIPFGLSEKEGKFLDVAEVAQGRQCGCICPSCKTPLIARHGQVKEWHFAHATKLTSSSTSKPCKFSFFVSVRLMARQILGDNLEILLPVYEDSVSVGLDPFYGQMSTLFNITGQKRITLTNIEVEQTFMGRPVDIIGHIGEFSFVIYFTHPGRYVPAEFYHLTDSHCGILAISLESLPYLFLQAKKQQKSYLKILHYFLTNNLRSKHWVFHPRYAQRKQQALSKLRHQAERVIEKKIKQSEERREKAKQLEIKRQEERERRNRAYKIASQKRHEYQRTEAEQETYFIASHSSPDLTTKPDRAEAVKPKSISKESARPEPVKKPIFYTPPVRTDEIRKIETTKVKKRQANFECVLCQSKWQGPETSDSVCPKCNTHLYRKFLGFVDE